MEVITDTDYDKRVLRWVYLTNLFSTDAALLNPLKQNVTIDNHIIT